MWDVVGVGANSIDQVYRLPAHPRPDSPGGKLQIREHFVSPGGQTATALCTCAAMGLRTNYVGVFGHDQATHILRNELTRRGVGLDDSITREAPNAYAVILIDESQGERVVLWDRDPRLSFLADEIQPKAIRNARLLHVDDVDMDAALQAASLARHAGVPITSDIERVTNRTQEMLAEVTVPILAEHVPSQLTGKSDFEESLRMLRRPHHQMLCVTLGRRGALLLDGDRIHRVPGVAVDVVDTTGAGDVFRGAFICALLRGDSPGEILRFANAAAAVSCTRPGAISSVPDAEEAQQMLRRPDA